MNGTHHVHILLMCNIGYLVIYIGAETTNKLHSVQAVAIISVISNRELDVSSITKLESFLNLNLDASVLLHRLLIFLSRLIIPVTRRLLIMNLKLIRSDCNYNFKLIRN